MIVGRTRDPCRVEESRFALGDREQKSLPCFFLHQNRLISLLLDHDRQASISETDSGVTTLPIFHVARSPGRSFSSAPEAIERSVMISFSRLSGVITGYLIDAISTNQIHKKGGTNAATCFNPLTFQCTHAPKFKMRDLCILNRYALFWSTNSSQELEKVLVSRIPKMLHFMILFSRQGKVRLQKWFTAYPDKQKKKIIRELVTNVLSRKPKMCSFLEYKDLKIVYKRYASLYFLAAIESEDNQLITLETIHRYVEVLDKYFGSVCELDIIFNFEKAYFILEELILGGEIQETGKKKVLEMIQAQDMLQEEDAPQGLFDDYGLSL